MSKNFRIARVLTFIGLALMLIGTIDPLEGAIVILAGSVILLVSAYLLKSKYLRISLVSMLLIAIGFGAMLYLSMIGGIGGNTGRSMWLLTLSVPYPLGWIMGIISSILIIRELKILKTNESSPA